MTFRFLSVLAVFVAALAAAASAQAAVSDGLALYSSMEGLTPGDPLYYWEDLSGNGHHVLRGIEVDDRSADMNAVGATNTHVTAADFEEGNIVTNMNAWVNDGYDASLEPGTTDFSFSLWYNEVTPDGFQYILNNGNTAGSGEPGFAFYTGGGVPRIRMQDAGASTADPNTRLTLSSGTSDISGAGWHHIVGTFDRSGTYSAANTVSIYVDGSLANSLVLPDVGGNPYNLSLPTKQLRFGGREINDHNFEGYLDDIALYQGVLSPTDVTTLLAASSVDANTVTTAGVTPLAVYNFENNLIDNAQPGTVPDDFDGNPAVLHGGTAEDDATRGDVLGFNAGAQERADYGDILDPGDGSYTVSAWVNVVSNNIGAQFVAGKGNASSSNEGWCMFIEGGKLAIRSCYEEGNGDARLQTSTPISAGEWHHVALVLDADTGTLAGYLDGVGSGATGDANGWSHGWTGVSFPDGVDFTTDAPLRIGNRSTYNAGMGGMLDDFAVWNRALTEQEILDIYAGADILDGGSGQPGDLNDDGYVNSADLDLVRGNWGTAVAPNTNGDATGDGFVNSADLDVVRGNWGAGPATAVPEPAVPALLLGVFAGFALKRRGK